MRRGIEVNKRLFAALFCQTIIEGRLQSSFKVLLGRETLARHLESKHSQVWYVQGTQVFGAILTIESTVCACVALE